MEGKFNGWVTKALQLADRRESAARQHRSCPKCGTEQVQLTDWSTPLLKWKCRQCKYRFEFELKPA